MKLEDTRISMAGVFRCCAPVASEYIGKEVEIGYSSKCPHCSTKFTLVDHKPYPLWMADEYLEKKHDI